MKKCSKCEVIKNLDDFPTRKLVSGIGYRNECKTCMNNRYKKNYIRLQEKLKQEETIIPNQKKCKSCNTTKSKDDFYKNKCRKDGLSVYCIPCTKQYFNTEDRREYDKIRNKKRSQTDNYIEYQKEYRKTNMHIFVKKNRERYQSNPMEKLKQNYRNNIRKYIDRKRIPSISILGCDWNTLKNHLESQFQEGMNWENHTQFGWHIDHIIPLASAKNEEELYKLNHYTNLQPLWWRDNIIKRDKIVENK
jgi:hypothetical protein